MSDKISDTTPERELDRFRSLYSHLATAGLLLILIAVVTLAGSPAEAVDFSDRAAMHQARLDGLRLDLRSSPVGKSPIVSTAATDIPDFRISKSTAPARFEQNNAELVQMADGGWLVAWEDIRQGSRKIFWQRYDSLWAPVGSNELVAGSSFGADFVEPRLAIDTLGRVSLFYRDRTNGLLFGSRFDANLQPDLAQFLVNDTSFNSFAGPFDFAVFPDGQAVVVWENYSTLSPTIAMRLYSPNGSSLLGPVTVNSDASAAQHWVPTVAIAPGSGFVVAWEDYRNGQADIYCRQFTGSGTAVGSDLAIVPPPADTAAQYTPEITYSSVDRYVIGWIDARAGEEVYLQRFSQLTGLVGGNRMISAGDSLVLNWDLHLAASTTGRTLATWADFGAANRILGLRLDSALMPAGAQTVLNQTATGRRWNPFARYTDDGTFAMCWTEFTDEDANISLMEFSSVGVPLLGFEIRTNDDQSGAPSGDPCIVASSPTRHVILWNDRRRDAGDIFLRNISVAGTPFSDEYQLNQDAGFNLQSEPTAAYSASRMLTVWIDSR
ncbi:hypothetical protein GF377_03680, partial [candidate division GN15 bacterium]|nr:hypothetical protein [candidate division GN15 bacterium]